MSRATTRLVIKLWGALITLQPIPFTWFADEAIRVSWVYSVVLVVVGLFGGIIGYGMIRDAAWLPRWFQLWPPAHIAGLLFAFYVVGEDMVVAIVSGVFLVAMYWVLSRLIQASPGQAA